MTQYIALRSVITYEFFICVYPCKWNETTEQDPSFEADERLACQDISSILPKQDIYYSIHNPLRPHWTISWASWIRYTHTEFL